ncbi:HD-GYP domain-containing protein [Candidatus Nitrospira bockiana]
MDAGLQSARSATATLTSFDAALDLRDPATYGHSHRTAGYALIVGRLLGLSGEALQTLERGVFLHDVGKIHVPDRVIKKPGLFCDAERRAMQSHTVIGYGMVSAIPDLEGVAAIVLAHHERYDGTGYPHRLEGDEIPLGARICAIVDCFDVLTGMERAYGPRLSVAEAWASIGSERGRQFDPLVVEACTALSPDVWRQIAAALGRPAVRRMDWDALRWPNAPLPDQRPCEVPESAMASSPASPFQLCRPASGCGLETHDRGAAPL